MLRKYSCQAKRFGFLMIIFLLSSSLYTVYAMNNDPQECAYIRQVLHIDKFDDAKRFYIEHGLHSPHLKKIGRKLIKEFAKKEDDDQYEALGLLLKGSEKDQTFSREQLFKNLLSDDDNRKIKSATLLFKESSAYHTNYKLIGARVLVAADTKDNINIDLRFDAAKALKGGHPPFANGKDGEIAKSVYRLCAMTNANQNQYEAAKVLLQTNIVEDHDIALNAFRVIINQQNNINKVNAAFKLQDSEIDADKERALTFYMSFIETNDGTDQNYREVAQRLFEKSKQKDLNPDIAFRYKQSALSAFHKIVQINKEYDFNDYRLYNAIDLADILHEDEHYKNFACEYYKKLITGYGVNNKLLPEEICEKLLTSTVENKTFVLNKMREYEHYASLYLLFSYGNDADKSKYREQFRKEVADARYTDKGPKAAKALARYGSEEDKEFVNLRGIWKGNEEH